MSGTVDVQEFIKHLHKTGLIIVNKDDFFENSEEKQKALHKELLKKAFCTLGEISKSKLVDVSKQTLLNKINGGDIADYEYKRLNDRHRTYKLTRKCIKRLRSGKKLGEI